MFDHDEIAIFKLVGSRMTEARLLCKLSRYEAAERLGVSTVDLEQIENGIDTKFIPLKLVRQASLIYDVSTDFLFGFSDDWESCEETKLGREIGAYVHQQSIRLFGQWAAKQIRLERQASVLAEAVNSLRLEVAAIYEALDRFRELNEKFELMPGVAMLVSRIEKGNQAALTARNAMIRANLPHI